MQWDSVVVGWRRLTSDGTGTAQVRCARLTADMFDVTRSGRQPTAVNHEGGAPIDHVRVRLGAAGLSHAAAAVDQCKSRRPTRYDGP